MNNHTNSPVNIKKFQENDFLKDKIKFKNDEIILEVHPDFIVRNINGKIYLNDKFYQNIKEEALLKCYLDFVQNDKIIYIQYRHKHFNFCSNKLKSYFKQISIEKYSFSKIKHFKDIEMIFDLKRVLYKNNFANLTEPEIIEKMYNEPMNRTFEKIFYSSDKKERVIIYQNSVNSFSYQFEKLTIIDSEERRFYSAYAIWEPSRFDSSNSFYESLDSLLNDLKVYIKDWYEKK